MSVSFSGLGAGFDVNSVVDQLMQLESRPLTSLQTKADTLTVQVNALNSIRTKLTALSSAADTLADDQRWRTTRAESSNTAVASVSVTGRATGSLTFTVAQLANRHALRTTNTFSSLTSTISPAGTRAVVGVSLTSAGITSVEAVGDATLGLTEIDVSRLATAATVLSTGPLTEATGIDATNKHLSISVDGGAAVEITLAEGTYTRSGTVTALQNALDYAGVLATADLDSNQHLRITSNSSGSGSQVELHASSSLAVLNLGVGSVLGQDGIITVNGVGHNVANTSSGALVDLPSGSGTLRLSSGPDGFQVGISRLGVVDTSNVGLGVMVERLNSTGLVEAAAVRVGTNSWRLQLTSNTSGSDGIITLDTSDAAAVGPMVTSGEGTDATLTVGSGVGAFQVSSATNTFAGLLPGITVTARANGTATVTTEMENRSGDVQRLVDATNEVLAELRGATRNTPGSSGPLAADAAMRRLTDDLSASITSRTSAAVGRAGVSLDRSGLVTFDMATFNTASDADRDAVVSLFTRQLSGPPAVTLNGSTGRTTSGNWQVVVTQTATKAQSGLLSASPGITVSQGGRTITYTPAVGQSTADTAQGLQTRLVDAGISVDVSVDGEELRLISSIWGIQGGFAAATSGQELVFFSGLNAQGTIDGQTAIGLGQTLSLGAEAASGARGVRLNVTDVGTHAVTFDAGIAGRLHSLASETSRVGHPIQGALEMRNRQIDALGLRVAQVEQRLATKESQLRRMYALLDANLGKLNSLNDWITSQVESLAPIGGNSRSGR